MAISLDRVNAACRGCAHGIKPPESPFGFLYIAPKDKSNGFAGTRAVQVGPRERWCTVLADPVSDDGVCDEHLPVAREASKP